MVTQRLAIRSLRYPLPPIRMDPSAGPRIPGFVPYGVIAERRSQNIYFLVSEILCWVRTGDGEIAACEEDGRSRGRSTPISPFFVSMGFAPARESHPGKRTGTHPTSFFIRRVLNFAEFCWFEQKSAEFRTFTKKSRRYFCWSS